MQVFAEEKVKKAKKICICRKKAVLLQSVSVERLDTRSAIRQKWILINY